jgi:hypothetical protein
MKRYRVEERLKVSNKISSKCWLRDLVHQSKDKKQSW